MKIKTLVVFLAILSLSFTAQAAVFNVNSTDDNPDASLGAGGCADANGKCTLRAAIEEANNDPELDLIALPFGQYVLSNTIQIISDVKIFGAGATQPQINGQNSVNMFVIEKNSAVELNNIWLTGGKGIVGGAIKNFGELTLSKVTVEDSEASGSGGAIGNYWGANLTITDSTIKDNYADDGGGAVNNDKLSWLTITRTVISGNKADDGGGISNHGVMKLEDVEITGNTASENGGGVLTTSEKTVTINKSTISNNTAHVEGGGIFNHGTTTIMNSTISTNKADEDGGGIASAGKKKLTLVFVTVAENEAGGIAGGILPMPPPGLAGDTVEMIGTIVARNKSDGKMDVNEADCSGKIKSFGNNIIGNGDGCVFNVVNSDQVGTSKALVNPKLSPLGNYGGFTKTHDLLSGSPALDKGTCFLNIDQREVKRPKGNSCDTGAVEHNGVNLPAAAEGVGKGYERANIPIPKPK